MLSTLYEPFRHWSEGGSVCILSDLHFDDWDCSLMDLMRGQIYELCGKKIFTFGGACSHDISGGILELDDPDYQKKKKELDKGWKPYRVNHLSWWEQIIRIA